MEKTYIVYSYKNRQNNKVYIGRTCQDIATIWNKEHKNNFELWSDIQLWGFENFEVTILETGLTNYESKEVQNKYILKLGAIPCGYNKTLNNLNNKNEKGPGRPKIDRSNKLILGFEVTKPLKVRLDEEAEKRNMTLSALIREILERHFEER